MNKFVVACFLSLAALQVLQPAASTPVVDNPVVEDPVEDDPVVDIEVPEFHVELSQVVTRDEAEEACALKGMKLVTVDSQEKSDKVLEQILQAKQAALAEACDRYNQDLGSDPPPPVYNTLDGIEDSDTPSDDDTPPESTPDDEDEEEEEAEQGTDGIRIPNPADQGAVMTLPVDGGDGYLTQGAQTELVGPAVMPYQCSTEFSLFDIGNFWTSGYETEEKDPREFTWETTSEPATSYTNWMRGEPNNWRGTVEKCLKLNVNYIFEVMRWNDEQCSAAANYVCEA